MRAKISIISLLICCFLFIVLAVESQESIFKTNKLNLIWNKAQHSLGKSKLKDLKRDLLDHEDDEVKLKAMKTHQGDKEGLFEASVRQNLYTILARYNLDQYYDDIHPPIEEESIFKRKNLDKISIMKNAAEENGAKLGKIHQTMMNKIEKHNEL